uniref:Ig-like domain-containing protein n=1 Tax=Takifugu rubripes TaxID=31033 RepID=H2SCR4_TAKRU
MIAGWLVGWLVGWLLLIGLTIDQSASHSIQAEGSVTLNCTVHTGWTCDGDHTVYWFRNSGPSQLGLMYSHTGRNKQCERETNTCFYSFSMKNLNTSQTGTYYCAVAACGHILFGNGTKLVCGGECSSFLVLKILSQHPVIYLIVIMVILISSENNLHYAALRNNQPNRSMQNRQNECVYSAVRL